MKRLIVKYNSIFRETERMEIEAKIRREWEERKAVFIPECCDYEIIDDGVNEAAIWLDQEIEKRKAAVEEEEYYKETCESLQKTIVKFNEIVQEQGLKLKEYEKAAVSKAAVKIKEYEDKHKCKECKWDEFRDAQHPVGTPCDSCFEGKNFSPKIRNRE